MVLLACAGSGDIENERGNDMKKQHEFKKEGRVI